MIPVMNRKGYDRDFNAAVTITSATTGLLIPPSNIMIVYSLAAGGLSVAAIFLAGFLPGILMGLGLMFVCWIIAGKKGYGVGEKSGWKNIFINFKRAFLSLLLVIIVLGGIIGGIFTATEASAVAVFYAFLLTVVLYKEVKWKDLTGIMLECGITTAVVMLLIGTSVAMSWVLAYENIPQTISAFLISLTENKVVIFLIINLMLLIVGTFMDMTPAISKVTRPLLPFFVAMIIVLFLITYLPKISLLVPQAFGYK